MKKALSVLSAALAAASLMASVSVDKAARAVTFTAKSAGLAVGDTIEFFAVGPLSDHDYETFLVTDDSPAAIAKAMDEAGVPRGASPDPFKAVLWPEGPRIKVEARLKGGEFKPAESWIADGAPLEEGGGTILKADARWTGGKRDGSGAPVASSEMPCAVWALYNHAPSLMQLDGVLEQSVTYGRFSPKAGFERGTEFEVRISWDGVSRSERKTVKIAKGADLKAVIGALRDDTSGAKGDLYVDLAFNDDVPLSEAKIAAKAFSLLDGPSLKMNGFAQGEFFFCAYLPDDGWRDRPGRIFQPFEIHVSADGTRKFIYIEEDWSGEGLDPILKPRETVISDWSEVPGLIKASGAAAEKITVMFIFAPASTPVSVLKPVLGNVPPHVSTFYIFESVEVL